MPNRATVTVLVPTFNEENNLSDCLSCLTWADQIIVCDSFSTDRTVEIAGGFTQHVYQHEYVNSATQKNWAMANLPIEGDWTLIVDADERVIPELAQEIRQALEVHEYEGFFVNRRNYFRGRWIRGCGWYPSHNLRLFRSGCGRYEDKEVDADVSVEGVVGYLHNDMIHLTYPTISDFLRKLDRYASWEAKERCRDHHDDSAVDAEPSRALSWRFRRSAFMACPIWFKPLLTFLNMYVWDRGFADGMHGFVLSALYAWREFITCAKMWEMSCRRDDSGQPK